MKNSQTYIDSGVLELFVYGTLPEEEMVEIAREVSQDTALLQEVVEIENHLMHLAKAAAPGEPKDVSVLRKYINDNETKVIPLSRKQTPIVAFMGWAAAILLLAGIGYLYTENNKLEDRIVDTERELLLQEGKTQVAETNLDQTRGLLNVIRKQDLIAVPLGAQAIAPEAYASVYWDKKSGKAYIDVKGLPEPPKGKVYQVWSLTLEPLTPTSIGVLDQYDASGNQIFELSNPNESEAFGITLEPEGGSASPTLEQLYTLGVVASS
ncbi:anti-sigma factor domain-containing protein [Dokdonia sp. Asnod1-B02]|uniref:anti-sigma factor n=1 Tax=Dokdonia sp. Asnod1-B02 TaxID=3160573 RepID=UPI00386673FD